MIDEEKFFRYCSDINESIWENSISKQDIEDWIKNFKPQERVDVRKLAFDLLMGFIYYNESEINFLCKHAFSEYKRQKMKEGIKKGQSIKEAENIFYDSINHTKFIGKTGDSSGYFAYLFRQINGLPLENFINSIEEIHTDTNILIMVDDFIGTGDTVLNFNKILTQNGIFEKYPKIQVYYLSLIVTEDGLKSIQASNPKCKLIYSELLSQDYKVFSENTKVLPDYTENDRKQAKIVCKKIGEFLEGELYELGYKNSELLIGLHHNIPDNTLPIIWSDSKDWVPIFSRKKKIYKM
jgi:hypothetical protein